MSRTATNRRIRGLCAAFSAMAVLVPLGACGDAALGTMAGNWKLVAGQEGELAYDPAAARQLPYATVEAYIGDAPAAMLVLGRLEGDKRHWISADRNVIVTRNGRVVKTVGLPQNLEKVILKNGDPLEQAVPRRGMRLLDLSPGQYFGVPVECEWQMEGPDATEIRGKVVQTQVWREDCVATTIDWSFSNRFWRDAGGFVWKSEQHYSPGAPLIHMAVLQPYGP